MFSETRKALAEIFEKAEDTIVVSDMAGLDKRAILKNLKTTYDSAQHQSTDFYDTTNLKEDTLTIKEFFNPAHRKLKCTNPSFLPFLDKETARYGSSLKQKGIDFRQPRWLEDLIMLRCNNMRVFYIETLRLFTVLEKQSHNHKNLHRNSFLYFHLRGLYNMEKRNLLR